MKRHQISTAVIVLCAGVSNVSWAQASVGPEPLIPLPALSAADSVTKLAPLTPRSASHRINSRECARSSSRAIRPRQGSRCPIIA